MADVIMSRLFRIEELGMHKSPVTLPFLSTSFVAGPNQSLENPFGEGVEGRLHGSLWTCRRTELVTHITYRAQR